MRFQIHTHRNWIMWPVSAFSSHDSFYLCLNCTVCLMYYFSSSHKYYLSFLFVSFRFRNIVCCVFLNISVKMNQFFFFYLCLSFGLNWQYAVASNRFWLSPVHSKICTIQAANLYQYFRFKWNDTFNQATMTIDTFWIQSLTMVAVWLHDEIMNYEWI